MHISAPSAYKPSPELHADTNHLSSILTQYPKPVFMKCSGEL